MNLLPETKETLRGIGYDFLIDELEKTYASPAVAPPAVASPVGARQHAAQQADAITGAILMARYVNMRLKEILDGAKDAEIVEGEYKVL